MTPKIMAPMFDKAFALLTNPPIKPQNPYMKALFQVAAAVEGAVLRRHGTESQGFR